MLLQQDQPDFGGTSFTAPLPSEPLLRGAMRRTGMARPRPVMRGRPLEEGCALIEAFVLAGGFLRIKRSVLERFREHYPDLWYVEPSTDPEEPDHKFTEFFVAEKIDHKFFGEDHAFSKRMRDMGARMMIYPNVDIVHWGYKDFGGNFDKFLKKNAALEQKAVAQ